MPYRPRVADQELVTRLASTGAVVIEGPKGCGKTATARQLAASEVLLDVDENARRAIEVDPRLVLDGPAPRLIDEWQIAPSIWNHIRRAVDDRGRPGQFILTGSAVPADDITRHTGAARLTRLRMRPMSLFETGRATGAVSLRDLLAGTPPRSMDTGLTVPDLAELVVVGGWPGNLTRSVPQSMQAARDYLDEIRRVDVTRVDERARDPEKVGRLLRALARHVATEVSITTLSADAGGADGPLARDTVMDYLAALDRLMIVEDQPAWAPHLRSRSRVRSAPKRHFVDPSLAAAALRATPERLLQDLNLLGFLFESLVVRDLRIYSQAADATVLQYRDNTGLEVDAVVEAADGRWAAFEVKLGQGQVDNAAATLLRFSERVDTGKCGPPAALGVIVATGYGYQRPDGVAVVPIGALGP
ncbi:ATP-binding protein [Nocardioides sp.]|uniref:ATP-binding protein n=1 Tax=Nocardioides sp. TaxID=35761 RepID=UPI002EDB50F6